MKLNDTTLDYDVLDAGERRASFRREYDARMWVKRMNILAGTHAS